MIGKLVSPLFTRLQRSAVQPMILKFLLRWDNTLRRMITFFSFEHDVHPKHRIMNYHQFFLDNVTAQDKVLDIGCGLGFVAYDVAQKGTQVTAIDIDTPSLTYAKKHHHHPHITFLQGDATSYAFATTFDVMILSNVLEHIEDRHTFLKKLLRLAPRLLVRVPMIDRDWIVILKKEQGIDYRLDPTHYTEFTEDQFRREVTTAGWHITSLSIRFGELYSVLTSSPAHENLSHR